MDTASRRRKMVFSNLFFIYMFLPLSLIAYFLAKDIKAKNVILLCFSLFFYAWGEPKYVFILIAEAFADYVLALAIEKNRNDEKKAKIALVGAVVVDLGLLCIFKYLTFILENVKNFTGAQFQVMQIALPIGISFYTFQLLSYVIDVYRGEVEAQKKFGYVLLYASLFHQCIAGPIVRYQDVCREIVDRKTDLNQISKGISRFAVGLGKKALLANVCGEIADMVLLSDSALAVAADYEKNLALLQSRPALGLWFGVLIYMLQIYLDFSAYSDMAIGMGQMIGFHYKENFDYPYMSKSVGEFWRRWHMSLGSFFRDYVYIPLGGNRKGMARTIFNMFVVWALTGLWHGASWNFVLWGLYFFVFLVLERLFLGEKLKKAPSAVSSIYLLVIVYFGWILFRFRNLSFVGTVLKGMFGLNANGFTSFEISALIKNNIFFLIVAVIAATPLMKYVGKLLNSVSRTNPYAAIFNVTRKIAVPVALLILSTMSLVGDSYNPFLYFQF